MRMSPSDSPLGYFLEGLLEKRRRFAYAINNLVAPLMVQVRVAASRCSGDVLYSQGNPRSLPSQFAINLVHDEQTSSTGAR
ncbi:hypothetical protein EC9_37900 [Rosistilla ulvae]|uniref:Uncharacterized protein n=1 Tax=Rosistilla ulvae TaxID=1930277 RepID=A0A517M3Y4_9BACT|nr:hypothetical protein EC9_37900 [Rosistilla ulvae]